MVFFDQPLPAAVIGSAVGIIGIVSSEVALGRFLGAVPVALGNISVLALLTAVWYWAHCERLSQSLDATAAQLEALEQQTSDLRHRLPGQVTRWQREAAAMGGRLEAMETERTDYENALGAIASRASGPVHHRLLTLEYEIGETPEGDRATERYSTSAGDPGRPLMWCDLRVAVSGADVPRLRSFRDLHDVEASQAIDGETFPLAPIPAGRIGPIVRALVLFEPPITEAPRDWMWSYRWPVWNPLRNTKQDWIGFQVLGGVQYDLVELHVIFPRSAIRPIMRPIEPENRSVPAAPRRDKSERQTIVVTLESPRPGSYSWALGVEGWRPQH